MSVKRNQIPPVYVRLAGISPGGDICVFFPLGSSERKCFFWNFGVIFFDKILFLLVGSRKGARFTELRVSIKALRNWERLFRSYP